MTDITTIAEVELNTLVKHLTGIDPLAGAFTHHTDTRHVNQDVLGLFVVPLERAVERITEETEVKTEVGLCGGLPFQVVITQLVTLETTRQLLTTVGSGDVVTGSVTLSTEACLTIVTLEDGVTGDIVYLTWLPV